MTTFVALYRGETVGDAKLVAVSAEPSLVGDTAARMLGAAPLGTLDPVIAPIERGRRKALRVIQREATTA